MTKFFNVLGVLGMLLIVMSVPCCIIDAVHDPCPPGSEKMLNEPIGTVGEIVFWVGAIWLGLAVLFIVRDGEGGD